VKTIMSPQPNPLKIFIHRNEEDETILSLLAQAHKEELNKSTLAEIASISYSVVHRVDMALYDALPPKLNQFMKKIDPEINWAYAYRSYKAFCLAELRSDYERRRVLWLFGRSPVGNYSTWFEFREFVADTGMEFSKMLLINPAILGHFETGITRSLPLIIRKRLEFFGMSVEDIAYLANLPLGEKSFDGE
jgi:hypothetical protein